MSKNDKIKIKLPRKSYLETKGGKALEWKSLAEVMKGAEISTFYSDETSKFMKEEIVDAMAAKLQKKLITVEHRNGTATSRYEKGNTMSNDIGLGREIKKDRPRDAVHIACIPVTLGEWMQPGVPVVVRKGEAFAAHDKHEKAVGVIDPFLPGGCPKGTKVWLMLNPGSITSLRHDWTHPAFKEAPKEEPKQNNLMIGPSGASALLAAQNRIRTMGKTIGKTYEQMLLIGHAYNRDGYIHVGDDDASEFMNNHKEDFWHDWTLVTGKVLKVNPSDTYFSCAC